MFSGMNPKQMAKMMKQMGIKTNELSVNRVIFEMEGNRLIIENPSVTEIDMKGQKTYQIIGEPKEEITIPEEDIKMVMEQTGKNRDEVTKALEETEGNIAEAILKLK
ncbi:nascent polypeptide-associated complex protein [Candidatus Micrarchaeota archaeon]|nr:nascent polypeptide-associated complex protein [Candidatus Micrarchaeota archaeon]